MFEEMKMRHLIGFFILGFVVLGIGGAFLQPSDMMIDVCIQLILYVVVPVWFFMYHFKKQGVSVQQIAFFRGVRPWLLPLLGLVVLSMALSMSTFWLQLFVLMPFAPWLVEFFLEPLEMMEGPIYIAFTVVSLSIIGPIAEEFIFRGLLLKRMMLKTSMWGGILISSILFGLLHSDIIGAFLFGVIASLLYLKTDNLLVPILMHIFNNSIAAIWMFSAPEWPAWGVMESADIYTHWVPNAIILVVSSVLVAWFIVRLARGLVNKKSLTDIDPNPAGIIQPKI